MISRRNIRAKVMQSLYSYELFRENDGTLPPIDPKKLLLQHFDHTLSLLIYVSWCITEIAQYAETEAQKRAGKYITSQEDLNVNTKIVQNEVVEKILQDKIFQLQVKERKPRQKTEAGFIKSLFQKLKETDAYKAYTKETERTLIQEKQIIEAILSEVLLENEDFLSHIEELFPNWGDDGEMIALYIASFIQKPKNIQFARIIDEEKLEFAQNLLQTVIDKEPYLLELISPKLKNWDAERIAQLDMILMKMGLTEFLYFDTIPPKVTINEYIDLAKDYSTQQSGHFINGILDNIHKEMVAAGDMHKKDFKRS